MESLKTARIISNAIYFVGAAIVLFLGIISLFGSKDAINLEAMIPFTRKEQAFIGVALGIVPMILSCMAVYKFNNIKNSVHKKRNFILIFLPGFICTLYFLFVIGVIIMGMINSFIFH